jgi:hypothetical protein
MIDKGLLESFLISGGAGIIITIGLFLGFSYFKKSID